jgi:hypothetical protein
MKIEMATVLTALKEIILKNSLVPRCDPRSQRQGFSNRNALLFAPGHAGDGCVTHNSILCMIQVEYGLDVVRGGPHKLRARLVLDTRVWSAHLRRKGQSLLDGQRREVDVILGAVHHVATIVSTDLRGRERVVVYLAFDSMELAMTIGKRLQEGAASRAWTPKNH